MMPMAKWMMQGVVVWSCCVGFITRAAERQSWPQASLSVVEVLNLALEQNPSIRKSRKDLEAVHGVVLQTQAIALPKLAAFGEYKIKDQAYVDTIQVPLLNLEFKAGGDQSWAAGVRVVQSLYEGGRIRSSFRTARSQRAQAMHEHATVVADALVAVRVAYYDVLLAEQQISVRDASVRLLEAEFRDATRRRDAGTVPEFNVIRAEVQWAGAKPALIHARHAHRLAKIRLANLLGFDVPDTHAEDIPLMLSAGLDAEVDEAGTFTASLGEAIDRARAQRPELAALAEAETLRRETWRQARGGYRPSLQAFAGYEGRNGMFSDELGRTVDGWTAGVQARWDLFDGRLTEGRASEARARLERTQIDREELHRAVELEVRAAYSTFIEAQEILESQRKVQEQAEEALRLAQVRYQAGSGTQLDLLAAETTLTEARTTRIQASRDFLVARARLVRAVGAEVPVTGQP